MTTYKKFKNIYVIPLLVLLCLLILCSAVPQRTVRADEASTGSILDDFSGTGFDISKYPYIFDDYSLRVIQIAESSDGKLFVYVYHPCGFSDNRVLAVHINMCTTYIDGKPADYKLYTLTPDKCDKTVYRYTVNDFSVKIESVRHYDIASITRSFIAGVDEEPDGDNTVTEKSYSVGQAWIASGIGDAVQYSMIVQDVIEVTSKYVASVQLTDECGHSHIIAFSTDRQIDDLYEVELIYTKQDVRYTCALSGEPLGNAIATGVQIDVTDIISADHQETVMTPNGKEVIYSWDRIQIPAEYLKSWTWSEDAPAYSVNAGIRENVLKHNWVIRFLTTSFLINSTGGSRPSFYMTRTQVFDTCILRLKFEENGIVYDLGVVDDIQSGKEPLPDPPAIWDNNYSGSVSF